MGQGRAELEMVDCGVIESRVVILKAEVSPGPKLNGTKDHIGRRRVNDLTSRVKAGSPKPGFRADADTRPTTYVWYAGVVTIPETCAGKAEPLQLDR